MARGPQLSGAVACSACMVCAGRELIGNEQVTEM